MGDLYSNHPPATGSEAACEQGSGEDDDVSGGTEAGGEGKYHGGGKEDEVGEAECGGGHPPGVSGSAQRTTGNDFEVQVIQPGMRRLGERHGLPVVGAQEAGQPRAPSSTRVGP